MMQKTWACSRHDIQQLSPWAQVNMMHGVSTINMMEHTVNMMTDLA